MHDDIQDKCREFLFQKEKKRKIWEGKMSIRANLRAYTSGRRCTLRCQQKHHS